MKRCLCYKSHAGKSSRSIDLLCILRYTYITPDWGRRIAKAGAQGHNISHYPKEVIVCFPIQAMSYICNSYSKSGASNALVTLWAA